MLRGTPSILSILRKYRKYTVHSLYLINEDRWDIYLYDFFSLFLRVQSAPGVGPTSYETLCILRYFRTVQKRIKISANLSVFCSQKRKKKTSGNSFTEISVYLVSGTPCTNDAEGVANFSRSACIRLFFFSSDVLNESRHFFRRCEADLPRHFRNKRLEQTDDKDDKTLTRALFVGENAVWQADSRKPSNYSRAWKPRATFVNKDQRVLTARNSENAGLVTSPR